MMNHSGSMKRSHMNLARFVSKTIYQCSGWIYLYEEWRVKSLSAFNRLFCICNDKSDPRFILKRHVSICSNNIHSGVFFDFSHIQFSLKYARVRNIIWFGICCEWFEYYQQKKWIWYSIRLTYFISNRIQNKFYLT